MARTRREDGPERIFHVTARVNWRVWHLQAASAKRRLADLIVEAATLFDVAILACVLMANHFHLVVQSPPEDRYRLHTGRKTPCRHFRPYPPGHQNSSVVSRFMRRIRRGMTDYRQAQLGLTGRFWEGDYDARPTLDVRALVVRIAYDHRNPVRAGIVPFPEEYPWSSAHEWATGVPGLVPIDTSLRPLGMDHETLRSEVVRFQQSRVLDDLEEFFGEGDADWASAEGLDTILEMLADRGLTFPHCGFHAARS